MKTGTIGPAILVTAAFIGPGTVFTATMAGANFGFSLLWALLFAVASTLILQEMSARLGIVTGKGLGENIRAAASNPIARGAAIILVVSAIVVGNGAYQSGNISGASLGLAALSKSLGMSDPLAQTGLGAGWFWPGIIGATAFALLASGKYRVIEKSLITLVALMSLAFVGSLILLQPDYFALLKGLLIPQLPDGSMLTVIALIGTTVVPYNLFLHASSASVKWSSPEHLANARRDLIVSIPLGGLISVAIVSTAATAFFAQATPITGVADLAPALRPVAGNWAASLIALGLFAAGVSSAVTAPLAAAYALSGILNIDKRMDSFAFRLIWLSILIIGVLVSSAGYRPVEVIWFAQVANGLLLPIIAAFLLWTMNSERLKQYRNRWPSNLMGFAVLLVTLMLSGRSLLSAFGAL